MEDDAFLFFPVQRQREVQPSRTRRLCALVDAYVPTSLWTSQHFLVHFCGRWSLLILATPRYRQNDPCASKASKVQQICGQKGIVEESCAPFPQLPGGPLHVGAPAALRDTTKGERSETQRLET